MVRIILSVIFAALSCLPSSAYDDPLKDLTPTHPRLIVTKDTWTDLAQKRKTDSILDGILKKAEDKGRSLLSSPVSTYTKTGKRLTGVSSTNIVLWAFDYRLTGEEVFLKRAEREMLTLASFPDWNPSHFLDTATPAMSMSLGYDWLYDSLADESRQTIRHAIVDKALKLGINPALPYNSWYTSEGNWNQVCFGALVIGALAVADEEPDLARTILTQARSNIGHGLKPYMPGGVYPEGPGYWSFGTTYSVMMVAALQTSLHTDWGIPQSPGFLASSQYQLEMDSPLGLMFDYSDTVVQAGIEPALYWMAGQTHRSDLLYFQDILVNRWLNDANNAPRIGILYYPLLPLWYTSSTAPNLPLTWKGEGNPSLAVFRESWTDPNGFYLAITGGSAALPHGKMNAGAFVFDADGIRWAESIPSQDYNSIESKGLHLFDRTQTGDRWKVFRLNVLTQNTLVIDDQLQDASAIPRIIRFDSSADHPSAVVDLTTAYPGAGRILRGIQILPNRTVMIQDELSGMKPGTKVHWNWVTEANVTSDGTNATFKKGGKQLQIVLKANTNTSFAVGPATPPNDYDAPNPGVSFLSATFAVPASGNLSIQVLARPGMDPITSVPPIVSCEAWPDTEQ